MNKDKQIEEMAKDIYMNTSLSVLEIAEDIAEYLTAKGYRKASDVVREIMQDVRQALLNMILKNAMGENYDIENRFAEIEKKYTENKGE